MSAPEPAADLTTDATTRSPVAASTPGPAGRTLDLDRTAAYLPAAVGPRGGRPRTVPGYELVRELGRGAFGVVYLGHRVGQPDTPFAIKVVEDPGGLDRLLVEPTLLAQVRHPNVVRLDDYFVHDGALVLVLEYVSGSDLKARLDRGGPLPPDEVRDFLVQIGSALAAAHARQVVHRDLKPSNVLVDASGPRPRYVLADFGVGRAAAGIRAEKDVGGTFLYMAPEQLRGRPGAQSDLWAAGVIAYQMLTGTLPFPGPSLHEVSRQIQYTDPPPPSTVTGRALPGRLEEAVLGLLRKSLTERTASAADLLAQLGVRDPERVEASAPPTGGWAVPVAESLRRAGRRALAVLVATLALYVLLNGVVGGVLVLTGLWLFYHAQAHVRRRARRALMVLAAFVVLSPRLVASFSPTVAKVLALGGPGEQAVQLRMFDATADALGVPGPVLFTGFLVLVLVLTLLLPVVGSAAYANLRRAGRERALLDAAVAGRAGSAEFLDLMRDLIATRFEDVGFHLRYAELLYARGDHRAAAVEARLITVQDPYHFEANLLLANAYLTLGLARECRRVCDDYLAVTGYCFEFQELRDQCAAGAA